MNTIDKRWCGIIGGKESIDLDDKTPAAHVVLAFRGGKLQAGIEAGTKSGGVADARRLDLSEEHFVQIPGPSRGRANTIRINLIQEASARPRQISSEVIRALHGLASDLGITFRYYPTTKLESFYEGFIGYASVTPKIVEIPVEGIVDGQPQSYSAQHVMMGAMRAALAHRLARPEPR